jgi:hypothetical protein
MQAMNMGQAPAQTQTGLPAAENHGPEKKFRAGAVSATIWRNERQRATGETFSYHTVALDRSYKDQGGNWKTASSLRLQDLPRAALVLQEAYRYLVLNGIASDEVVVE